MCSLMKPSQCLSCSFVQLLFLPFCLLTSVFHLLNGLTEITLELLFIPYTIVCKLIWN